jgi:hypothetical protein
MGKDKQFEKRMRLYSYYLRYDDGAAPNPYWGICTLAICKPKIRRTAEIGDWIVGLGSANSPIGDISGCVVYAMQVTIKMTLAEYDTFCRNDAPKKIPNWRERHFKLRMGDCIYDFLEGPEPKLRWSIHSEANRVRDLGGKYVLISKHFYYFGDHPIQLPLALRPIIHNTQGHKSDANQPYLDVFVNRIENSGMRINHLYGEPQMKKEFVRVTDIQAKCSLRSLEEA